MARIAAAPTLTLAAALGALGALSALSACGPSDAEMREEVRAGVLGSCLEARGKAAPAAPAVPAGSDWREFCSCVTDRLTEGRSGRELKARAPEEAERREAVALCRAETAPVPDPAPSAPAR